MCPEPTRGPYLKSLKQSILSLCQGLGRTAFFKFYIALPFRGITVLYFIFFTEKLSLFPAQLLPGLTFRRLQTLSPCSWRILALDHCLSLADWSWIPGWGSVLGPWPPQVSWAPARELEDTIYGVRKEGVLGWTSWGHLKFLSAALQMLLEEEDCDLGFYHSHAGGSSKARLVWSMSEAVTESSKSHHHSVFPQHLLLASVLETRSRQGHTHSRGQPGRVPSRRRGGVSHG